MRETARATSLIVDREVQGSLSALKALGHSRSLQQGDLESFYAEAGAINHLPDVWTLLVDENGRQVLNTIAPFGSKPPPAPSAEAASRVAAVLASGQPEVSELLVGPVTGKLLTTVVVPVPVGPKRYLLVQAFAVDHWRRTVLRQQLPADWIVGVIDRNGRFIARDLLGRVFEPFVQGPPPSNRAHSGLGIGLALVRQLVSLHGGEVQAASAGAGQGSTFRFWLPRASSPTPPCSSTSPTPWVMDIGLPDMDGYRSRIAFA